VKEERHKRKHTQLLQVIFGNLYRLTAIWWHMGGKGLLKLLGVISSDYSAWPWFTCHCRVLEDESKHLEVVSVSLAPPLPNSQNPPGMKEVGNRHICHPQRYSEGEEFDKTIHQVVSLFH
jgi:hypothetical protein